MPKVSVIIPVYGVEKYIERCARSLFEQTLDDIEYLFIDDCTPDRSIDILKQVLEEYPIRKPQVTIHRMEHNSGQAKVREWGMRNATGEYVIHCDSDDWVDTDMYRAMYEKAVADDSDVSICDAVIHNGVKNLNVLKGCNTQSIERLQHDMLYMRTTWSMWNKLFRRELYDKIMYYPEDNMGEDMLMTMQMMRFCRSFSYTPQPYYKYYMNDASIVRFRTDEAIIRNFHQNVNNINKLIAFYEHEDCYELYCKEIQWIQFHIKSLLNLKSGECKQLCKVYNPNVEWKELFSSGLSVEMRIKCIKFIIKYLLY